MCKSFKYIVSVAALLMCGLALNAQEKNYGAVKTSKNVIEKTDGSYDLVLETYVTGSGDSRVTTVTKNVPLDIALVLDVSGSMDETISGVYDETGWSSLDKISYSQFLAWRWSNRYFVEYNGEYYQLNANGVWRISIFRWEYGGTFTVNGVEHKYSELTNKKIYKTVSKLVALQRAAKTFIDNIAEKSTNEAVHQISIVKFAGNNSTQIDNGENGMYESGNNKYNYSMVVRNLTPVSSNANINDLKSAVDGFIAGGATQAGFGMAHAKSILDASPKQRNGLDVNKVVVMFTDGAPTSSNSFEAAVANSAISTSNAMKNAGVKVYTVGTFGSTVSNNVNTYMDRVSSNYTGATNMTNTSAQKVDNKYYMLATSNDGLNSVFSTISNDITSEIGKADYEFATEDVVVRDVVTEHFVLPEGTSNVSLKVVPAVSCDATFTGEGSFEWGTATDAPSTVQAEVKPYGTNETTIDVTGFDFAANWVGLKKYYKNNVEDKSKREVHGYKLVITINVTPSPSAVGGPVKTNTDDSGVYIEGENGGDPVKPFIVPATQFIPMDLIIRKSGLSAGESTMFTITRKTGGALDSNFKPINVVLTSDGGTSSTTLAKLPVCDDDKNVYTYVVTENTSWAWNHKNAEAVKSHALFTTSGDDEYTATNVFEFSAESSSSDVKSAEKAKANSFSKQ